MHNGNHFGARGNIFPALQCHGSKTRAAAWNVDKVPKAMPKVGKTIDIPPFLIPPFFGDDSINTFHIAPDGKNENWVDDDRCGSGYLLAQHCRAERSRPWEASQIRLGIPGVPFRGFLLLDIPTPKHLAPSCHRLTALPPPGTEAMGDQNPAHQYP